LKAPFDGTVIARFADPGALMQAATTNQASSLPVMQIADNSKLRVGIYVEQRDVAAIKVGDETEVVDASNPDRRRKAKISRTAGTLDPRTRTLFVEIDVDNSDQFLVPGSFVYVNLRVPVQSYLQIPVTALMQRGGTQQVAVIGPESTLKFRPIKIASTDGAIINVSEGLQVGERVGLNVSNDLAEGAKVRASDTAR
jgi:membrane fusion protein, multidrug efflux system